MSYTLKNQVSTCTVTSQLRLRTVEGRLKSVDWSVNKLLYLKHDWSAGWPVCKHITSVEVLVKARLTVCGQSRVIERPCQRLNWSWIDYVSRNGRLLTYGVAATWIWDFIRFSLVFRDFSINRLTFTHTKVLRFRETSITFYKFILWERSSKPKFWCFLWLGLYIRVRNPFPTLESCL